MGNIGVPQLLIIAAIVLLLFGSRKLPDMARGLGQSLRIFKAETKSLIEDDNAEAKEQPAIKPETSAGTSDKAAEPSNESAKRDS